MSTGDVIRVGLIGCNKRALWYGALFDAIDPERYAELDPAAYHHMTYYQHVELQVPRAEGLRLAKVYDPEERAAKRIAGAFLRPPVICHTLDDLIADVDLVFIANERGDGSAHPVLATPALEAGIPLFIDRPFAATVEDAQAMITMARWGGTPIFSSSPLAFLPHVARFKSRFAEIGEVTAGMVIGHGPNPAHIADGVELALALFADALGGRAASAQSMGAWPLEVLRIGFGTEDAARQVLVSSGARSGHRQAYFAKATAPGRPVESPAFDAFIQPEGGVAVLEAVKAMVETRQQPVELEALIEPVAIMEAARLAHDQPEPVLLDTVRDGWGIR